MKQETKQKALAVIGIVAAHFLIRFIAKAISYAISTPEYLAMSPETVLIIPHWDRFIPTVVYQGLMGLGGLAGVWWFRRTGKERGGVVMPIKNALIWVGPALGVGMLLSAVCLVLSHFAVQGVTGAPPIVWPKVPEYRPFSFVVMTISAPIFEELLYRGFIYRGLARYVGTPLAVIGSTMIFWYPHGFQNWEPIALGIVLAVLVQLTGRLEAVILVHALYNLAVWLPNDENIVFGTMAVVALSLIPAIRHAEHIEGGWRTVVLRGLGQRAAGL